MQEYTLGNPPNVFIHTLQGIKLPVMTQATLIINANMWITGDYT